MNRLANTRCYLCGPIETCPNGGMSWRQEIQRRLAYLNIQWLDPCNKPTAFVSEEPEDNRQLQQQRAEGQFKAVREKMLWIRRVDLRLVHLADFLIVHLDSKTPTFGSMEEITWANQEKKPILVHYAQGKTRAPLWLFGMIPHEMIFSSWVELELYLRYLAVDYTGVGSNMLPIWSENRWHLFDWHGE